MKITRLIAAPIAAAALVVGTTVGVAGVASAEPVMPGSAELNPEAFAEQLGVTTAIGGFAGTAVGAALGCILLGGIGGVAGPPGSIAGCTAGAGFGGLVGTLIGGSVALPALFPA